MNELEIKIGDLVLYPADEFKSFDELGIVIDIKKNYFDEYIDDESQHNSSGYRVEWIANGQRTVEDYMEITYFRKSYLDKIKGFTYVKN